jgi:hypothetical protein
MDPSKVSGATSNFTGDAEHEVASFVQDAMRLGDPLPPMQEQLQDGYHVETSLRYAYAGMQRHADAALPALPPALQRRRPDARVPGRATVVAANDAARLLPVRVLLEPRRAGRVRRRQLRFFRPHRHRVRPGLVAVQSERRRHPIPACEQQHQHQPVLLPDTSRCPPPLYRRLVRAGLHERKNKNRHPPQRHPVSSTGQAAAPDARGRRPGRRCSAVPRWICMQLVTFPDSAAHVVDLLLHHNADGGVRRR